MFALCQFLCDGFLVIHFRVSPARFYDTGSPFLARKLWIGSLWNNTRGSIKQGIVYTESGEYLSTFFVTVPRWIMKGTENIALGGWSCNANRLSVKQKQTSRKGHFLSAILFQWTNTNTYPVNSEWECISQPKWMFHHLNSRTDGTMISEKITDFFREHYTTWGSFGVGFIRTIQRNLVQCQVFQRWGTNCEHCKLKLTQSKSNQM